MTEHFIAWWNLENLFDVENSSERPLERKEILAKELEGWDEEVLRTKLTQLSRIIFTMNNNAGPDVLGICEVENGPVVDKLLKVLTNTLNRKYDVIHNDADEKRGIEVAFIYDKTKFTSDKEQVLSHSILRKGFTRNILQITLKSVSTNNELILIGNHWPARTIGELESEPSRIIAGEALNYFHKSVLKEKREYDPAMLVMGDFNDQPFNRSLTDYALSTNSISKMADSENEEPYLYNLMWPLLAQGLASFYHKNYEKNYNLDPTYHPTGRRPKECYPESRYHRPPEIFPNMLDQFMVSRGILFDKKFNVKQTSVSIIKDTEMIENCIKPDAANIQINYRSPSKYGRKSNESLNPNGFSDHFPISLIIEDK